MATSPCAMTPIDAWRQRWHLPHAALIELEAALSASSGLPTPISFGASPEAQASKEILVDASRHGVKLFRNNVGVLQDETGRPVRYGLANESPQMNQAIKSSDFIGWESVVIRPDHVGTCIARFVAREAKHGEWRYRGDKHETAQKRWLDMITLAGGNAKFATGYGSFEG